MHLRPHPHVSVFFWKRNFLRCGYGFRPHVSDENGHRKRNFLKTLSRVEFFENAVFVFPCWRGNGTFRKLRPISIGSSLRTRARENGGKWWFHDTALHKAAMKYSRMPKPSEKLLYRLCVLERNNAQQTHVNILSSSRDFRVTGNFNEKFNFVVYLNQIFSLTLF